MPKSNHKQHCRAATLGVESMPFRERLKVHVDFVKTFVRAPRQTGSICPSSKALVSALVRAVPQKDCGLVVDLGAGTGIITEELLSTGVPAQSVVAVECCESLVETLRHKFPEVLILGEDARDLNRLLAVNHACEPVRAIVSSLPFRSMPNRIVDAVAYEMKEVLQERGGCLIQYSYLWWLRYPLRKYGFIPQRRFLVFKNVPPAVVEVYTVHKH